MTETTAPATTPSLKDRLIARLTGKTLTTDAVAVALAEAEAEGTAAATPVADADPPPAKTAAPNAQAPAGQGDPAASAQPDPQSTIIEQNKSILAALAKLIQLAGGEQSDPNAQPAAQTQTSQPAPTQDADALATAVLDAETASRAEILAPGIALTGDVRAKALAVFAATDEGRAILTPLLGGRALDSATADTAEVLFVAAAAQVAAQRREVLASSSVREVKDAKAPEGRPNINEMSASDTVAYHRKRRNAA